MATAAFFWQTKASENVKHKLGGYILQRKVEMDNDCIPSDLIKSRVEFEVNTSKLRTKEDQHDTRISETPQLKMVFFHKFHLQSHLT